MTGMTESGNLLQTRLSDFWYILSDPIPQRLGRMIRVGQQSTFPKLLFIANRMKIEHLVEEGLLLGGSGKQDLDSTNERRSMHLHGQAMRTAAEPSTETEDEDHPRGMRREDRRSSVLQEIKRQSGVFFDDVAVDGEETGESDEDSVALKSNGHGKTE